MCGCGTEVETTEHFLLQCHFYSAMMLELFKSLEKIDPNFLNLNEKDKSMFYYTVIKETNLKVSIKVFLTMLFHT